jgi:hypothetical protein
MFKDITSKMYIDLNTVDETDLLRKVYSTPREFPKAAGEVLKELPILVGDKLLVAVTFYYKDDKKMVFAKVTKNDESTYSIVTQCKDNSISQTSIWRYQEDGTAHHDEENFNRNATLEEGIELSIVLYGMKIFFDKVKENQTHPFYIKASKKELNSPIKRKREKARDDNNTIIYLGRPPTEHGKDDGESVPLEFGYPRRAHYKTLRHERYRHHPMYNVYHGVKVRQSWCGPKEYKVKNRIYKLFEHESI